ncbi:MAG TPA: ATP-binding protein [Woeseiaceae bacterium]|nr:ATP-binding protein [Woeseiaceae bacterium]
MASGIAHEINQPLTAISLFAQAGKRLFDMGEQERAREMFDKLSTHAQRAGAVIERVQSMARRRDSATEAVDCNRLIEDVVKLAEAEARIYDISIRIDAAPELPVVKVDAVQIQQVILNLLRNAMQSMRSVQCRYGNSIVLETSRRDDHVIRVAVVDTGTGVSEDFAETLFIPFKTSKESGMGMGLSISQSIVAAHDGELGFFSNDSHGATFYFTLPIHDEEESRG